MPDARRIAVLRALPGLGDMLCLVPALRSLRAGSPRAEVTLVGLPSASWMVTRYPRLLDDFLPIGAWPGLPVAETGTDERLTARTLRFAQAAQFDLAIQLHGTGWFVNDLTAALGARRNAGHHPAGQPAPPGYFLPWPESGHEIHRITRLLRWLGYPNAGDHLEFPAQHGDLDESLLEHIGSSPFVVVHPGASRPDRRWLAGGFAAVVDALGDCGIRSLITGAAAERELADRVAGASRVEPTVLAGSTSLGALATTLRRADAVVCNDTGVAHLAVAVGTPAVVLFTTSDEPRWAPLDRARNRVVRIDVNGCAQRVDADAARVARSVLEVVRAGPVDPRPVRQREPTTLPASDEL